ncbi:hypothetical protein ABKPCSM17A_03032 [Acinetobacter baumannii]|nr:hypothetical protein ABKPCSM17A_03032 [Acinetobacter baumannii]
MINLLGHMKRYWKQTESIASRWTTEQDCFLIENNSLSIDELKEHLPFSEDEIRVRRSVLGLVRRDQQMRPY